MTVKPTARLAKLLAVGVVLVAMAAHGTGEVAYRVRPRTRGRFAFGRPEAEVTGFPGLAAVRFALPLAAEVPVYPDTSLLRRLALGARARELTRLGLRQLRREGEGDEFDKLRDYAPDDDFRDINWKATAKRSRPVTQVYEAERSQRVILALDCGR